MITGETRRRGISRHETKIRGIRCNKQTDLELIYEIPDFPVRGNGPSDDFLYCGIRPFIGPSGAGRFHRRGKGWHEDSGRYPADPGGTSGVGGSPQGIRFSGFLGELLQMPAALLHIPPQIVPVVLVRLVSNSAATGLVLDIFKEYGTDSSLGLIASVLMSSTETVLYCLSVYFGSVGITRTRYTLAGGLIATAAGVAASVVLAGAVR